MKRALPISSALLALALLAGEWTPSPARAGDADDRAQELEDLRYQIRASRRRAQELSQNELQQVARLDELQKEAALIQELLEGLGHREAEIQSEMMEIQLEIDGLQTSSLEREESLARRLREIYMRPRRPIWMATLLTTDLSSMAARLRATRHVARTERAMIDEVLDEQRALGIQQDALEERAAEIQLNRSEARDRQARLDELRGERAASLEEIRRQQRTWETSAQELEAAARRLEDLMVRLEAERESVAPGPGTSGAFEALRGRLSWPVRGQLLRGFGPSEHPEFGTRILNKGLNIAAPMGSPIQCIAAGVVDFVDWLPGYGRCIIVNHGDGYYSLYAHASTLFPTVGSELEAGQVIGEVGDTGSLEGSQLYLEIRRGKEPLDPAAWLRSGRR